MKSYIGKSVSVLFETPKNNIQQGYTPNYTPVLVKNENNLCGQILDVKITSVYEDYCEGILL